MTSVITIRPEPGLAATIARGCEAGLAIEGAPLFEIRPLEWDAPPPEDFDALLIGSGNAIRHGGPALDSYSPLPVHAVGGATAAVAEQTGFRVERVGEGGLQALVDRATDPIRYLRLAGAEHVALDIPRAVSITLRRVYESAPLPLPAHLAARLAQGALVLLHSAGAARHFAAECERLAIPRERISIAALGPRIAQAAGGGWADLRSAEQPDERALLVLARDMCH